MVCVLIRTQSTLLQCTPRLNPLPCSHRSDITVLQLRPGSQMRMMMMMMKMPGDDGCGYGCRTVGVYRHTQVPHYAQMGFLLMTNEGGSSSFSTPDCSWHESFC